jgi:P4 family phage/plasmid primase-like protien
MTYNTLFAACLWKKQVLQLTNITNDTYKEFMKQFTVPVESVGGDRQVKPYIDTDPVMSLDYTDEDWEIDILNNKLSILECFPEISIEDIRCIKRKYEVKDGVKYSVHYIVDKIRMSACNMPSMFEALNLEGFDKSVYDKNRFLTSIYTDKKVADGKTKDLPMFMPDGCDNIKHYLVSYIEEDFVDYDLKFPKREVEKPKVQSSVINEIMKVKCEDYDLIKSLVECLNKDRAEAYDKWLDVGFCLYNISDDLLELWDTFSQKSDKYISGECDKLWSKMEARSFSIGSLKYWAKLDSPKNYEDIIFNSLTKCVDECVGSDGAHYDIAVVTSKIMKDRIVYDGKVKSWYIVNDKTNIWDIDVKGDRLANVFAKDVCKVFLKASIRFCEKACNCDENFKTSYEEKAKKCINISKQMKNACFQESVKKMLKAVCLRDDFFEKYINKKEHLFAFNNGVYDLNIKTFRPIEPTDYISITAGYDYIENVDIKYIKEVEAILKDIQPNDDNYNYMIDVLSSRLYGKNIHQQFYIFTGAGANGKSVLFNMMRSSFGKYCGKVNAETFTKESKGANQTSEVSGVSLCRSVVIEEPNENDKLIVNRLKEFSGDAPLKTRGLYQEAYEFMPQFGLIFLCNEIPKLSKVEYAIARRLRVLSFETKFCEQPKLSHEKAIDNSLNEKIANDVNYKMAFMNILINNWSNRDLKNKLNTPLDVIEKSNEYMDGCNEVKIYLEEYYMKVEDETCKIGAKILYDHFKAMNRNSNVSNVTFKALVEKEGFRNKRLTAGSYYLNIKEKPRTYDDVEE